MSASFVNFNSSILGTCLSVHYPDILSYPDVQNIWTAVLTNLRVKKWTSFPVGITQASNAISLKTNIIKMLSSGN
jgi:hypothetical protein